MAKRKGDGKSRKTASGVKTASKGSAMTGEAASRVQPAGDRNPPSPASEGGATSRAQSAADRKAGGSREATSRNGKRG